MIGFLLFPILSTPFFGDADGLVGEHSYVPEILVLVNLKWKKSPDTGTRRRGDTETGQLGSVGAWERGGEEPVPSERNGEREKRGNGGKNVI
jgi:hypothetical protein